MGAHRVLKSAPRSAPEACAAAPRDHRHRSQDWVAQRIPGCTAGTIAGNMFCVKAPRPSQPLLAWLPGPSAPQRFKNGSDRAEQAKHGAQRQRTVGHRTNRERTPASHTWRNPQTIMHEKCHQRVRWPSSSSSDQSTSRRPRSGSSSALNQRPEPWQKSDTRLD